MKPTKSTVYLPVRENIIFHTESFKKQEGYFFTPEQLNEYTQSVIKQALETAAEKADITYTQEKTFDFTEVDKQSITDTFEETYKKFKL